jgi:hypothetical protein
LIWIGNPVWETKRYKNEYFTDIVGLSQKNFCDLVDALKKITPKSRSKFELKSKLLLTFVRLKQCLNYRVLSWIFGISISTVHNYLTECLPLIHQVLN